MKKNSLSNLTVLLIISCLVISYSANAYDLKPNGYEFVPLMGSEHNFVTPDIPDLKQYTLENIIKKIPHAAMWMLKWK